MTETERMNAAITQALAHPGDSFAVTLYRLTMARALAIVEQTAEEYDESTNTVAAMEQAVAELEAPDGD